MFNMNELFIPSSYDLTAWTDIDNLIYKNKAFFQYNKIGFENGFYGQYFDFVEKSPTTQEPMNSNYSIIIGRIKLYLATLDDTVLDTLLDGELRNWSIDVTTESMIIEYNGDYSDKFKSYKEKAYIINIKEYESELTKYKELRYCIDKYENKYDQIVFLTYEKFIDTIEKRLIAEETDKTEADAIILQYKNDYKNNQGTIPNDEWENLICVIESYKTPIREVLESSMYVIPYNTNTSEIDYSLLNTKLKEVCLKEQNKY